MAWRFSVSSWGGSTTLAASAVYKPDHGASPQVHPIRPASDRLPGLPGQGLVRLFTGWGAPQPPKPQGSSPGQAAGAAQQVRARAVRACPPPRPVPSRGVEKPLLLVPFLLILVGLGIGVTVAEGPAVPLALVTARTVTEAMAGRVATSLRPPGGAPSSRSRLRLGSGSPRVAQHPAAQRAHGSQLPETAGSAPQGAQHRRSPAMARAPPPASTEPELPTPPTSHLRPRPLQRTPQPPSSAPPAASGRPSRADRRTSPRRFYNKARNVGRMRTASLRKGRGKARVRTGGACAEWLEGGSRTALVLSHGVYAELGWSLQQS